MPDEKQIIEEPVIKKGKVKFSWSGQAPVYIKIITKTIVYSGTAITGGISMIPGISGGTIKIVAVVVLIAGSIAAGLEKALGVVEN